MKLHFPSFSPRGDVAAVVMAAMFFAQSTAGGMDSNLQPAEFNLDIRPILSDRCFACHGPDEANRKTSLRFDTEEGAFTELAGGGFAIVRGEPEKSVVLRRITSDNEAVRMPPAYLGHDRLSDREIDLIRRWIGQGARWQNHWSFAPPKRSQLPRVKNQDWPRNPIDYFVLRRLEREGLQPSPEADQVTLIRRVTLDLTGLPPTPAEVDIFLNDNSSNAYERVVDRLLRSPRYGERVAVRWLDAARYGDTNGYSNDGLRNMWRWRDWVINAFNRNMPFDQFTVEQIAGDMLPNATRDQVIATAFNRNHRTNAESGLIDEEFRVEYVADRVETTSTVWLGLTVGCARCHDHKFDPITQKDYYRLFAYFNNVPERGLVFDFGNDEPYIKAPTPEQEARLNELDRKIAAAERRYASHQEELGKTQRDWEKWVRDSETPDWSVQDRLVLHFPLDGNLREESGAYTRNFPSGEYPPETDPEEKNGADQKKPSWKEGPQEQPLFVGGKVGHAGTFDGKRFVDAGQVANFNYMDPFSLAAWIYPTAPNGAIMSSVEDVAKGQGYGLHLRESKLRFHFTFRWTDVGVRLETEQPLPLHRWHHVLMTYDGKRKAEGTMIYLNGKAQKLRVLFDQLFEPVDSKGPFRIGAGEGPKDRFRGHIDDVRVYQKALSAEEAEVLALVETIPEIAATPPETRSRAQANKLAFCFLDRYAPEPIQQARQEWVELQKEREEYFKRIPTVMVMKERETTRETFVLKRGAYDAPGEKVLPGVPRVLPSLSKDYPNNRLGFARWLVHPGNPLPARVTVNRFWQMLFGVGLVKTAEDFGSQGEWPLHLELLDWLATEFIEGGWNAKAVLKTIVMSATYRQSSKVTPELVEKDPENRLLARGPRFRLPAEVIRDQALALSGLLTEEIGGPSVKPYQPPGLWKELSYAGLSYQADKGENLYRRSLYTYWKRTVAPPAMTTFDAPDRETCTVRTTRTNTPLQALNLMNDVTYLEASRKLAERMMKEGGVNPRERIDYAFRLATARPIKAQESEILLDTFQHFQDSYLKDPEAAVQFLSEGESERDKTLDPAELASYTAVASLILNLDETVTKE